MRKFYSTLTLTSIFLSLSAASPLKEVSNSQTAMLNSGSQLTIRPVWLYDLSDEENPEAYGSFAVSGKYLLVADNSDLAHPAIRRYDSETGEPIDRLMINFGNLPSTSMGHIGCDDYGNVFISSALSTTNDKILFDDYYWEYCLPTGDTISIINPDGTVTGQITVPAPRLNDSYTIEKFDRIHFDHITVRGNLVTKENLMIAIPVGATITDCGTAWIPNYFMPDDNGDIQFVDFTSSRLSLGKDIDEIKSQFNNSRLTTAGQQSYCTVYPLNWQRKRFYNYSTDASQAVISLSSKETGRYIIGDYATQRGTPYDNVNPQLKPAAGTYYFKCGTDTLMSRPYIDLSSGQIRIAISQPRFNCSQPIPQQITDSHITSTTRELASLPYNVAPTMLSRDTDKLVYTMFQSVIDNHSTDSNLITHLYFHAPGRGFGKYTLTADKSIDSVDEITNDRLHVATIEGSVITVHKPCRVTIHRIDGREMLNRTCYGTETIDLNDLPRGFYIIKAGTESYKFFKDSRNS